MRFTPCSQGLPTSRSSGAESRIYAQLVSSQTPKSDLRGTKEHCRCFTDHLEALNNNLQAIDNDIQALLTTLKNELCEEFTSIKVTSLSGRWNEALQSSFGSETPRVDGELQKGGKLYISESILGQHVLDSSAY